MIVEIANRDSNHYLLLGGCVAHELIKLITKQYRPIDNTFLYNAITSESAVYRL